MRHTLHRLLIGLSVLSLASGLSAGTVKSPYRHATAASSAARPAVAGQQWLDLDVAALSALRSAGPGTVEIKDFPVAPGATGRLVLRRFEVASPDARIRVTGTDGDTFLPFPSVAHFSGRVEGNADSLVYVAAREDQLVVWIRSSEGTSYVGPDEAKTGFVVRDSTSPANAAYAESAWRCASEDLPEPPSLSGAAAPVLSPRATQAPDIAGFQKSGVIVETDQELLATFSGNVTEMAAYLLTIYGQLNLIYERDLSVHLTVTEVHAWATTDPWDGPLPIDQLRQLGDWYHDNRPIATFPRATVFLDSGITVQGGVAWNPGLCVADVMVEGHWAGGYGITQLFGTYPSGLWDLFSTAHEIGHNAGSKHTHCYTPAIDHCFSGEGAGCYVGPTSVPPEKGTLMSYCYLLPGEYDNVNFVFHPRCITEQMLPFIESQTCFTAIPTFPDVPTTNPFFHFIQTIYQLGITGGCAGGNYCPNNPVSRQQMAVFLLKAKNGSAYAPPPCDGTVFDDVPCTGGTFDPWIEDLANQGIAGGCGGGLFCPTATVTRKQMAPFLLKTLYGSSHVPPEADGIFVDVPLPNNPFAPFIEELYQLGITGGCATAPLRYCPDNPNTRAQMAVFLVKTFNLVW